MLNIEPFAVVKRQGGRWRLIFQRLNKARRSDMELLWGFALNRLLVRVTLYDDVLYDTDLRFEFTSHYINIKYHKVLIL